MMEKYRLDSGIDLFGIIISIIGVTVGITVLYWGVGSYLAMVIWGSILLVIAASSLVIFLWRFRKQKIAQPEQAKRSESNQLVK
jgi:uncharacterized membrane protein HdeD (DUF308 family)